MAFGSLAIPAFLAGVAAAWVKKGRKEKRTLPKPDFQLWPELAQVLILMSGCKRVRCVGGLTLKLLLLCPQDKVCISSYELCLLLLVDDINYPCWIVLVPQQTGVTVRC